MTEKPDSKIVHFEWVNAMINCDDPQVTLTLARVFQRRYGTNTVLRQRQLHQQIDLKCRQIISLEIQ